RPAVVARRLGVADADAEHEPPGEVRAQGRVGGRGLAGVAAPHVEDAGRCDEGRRRLQNGADVGDLRRAAHPPRAVPELLGEPGRIAGTFDAERPVAGPDADLPYVHAYSLTARIAPLAALDGSGAGRGAPGKGR